MINILLFGLPGERPGGLLLTLIFTLAGGGSALIIGAFYACIEVLIPRASQIMQAFCALLRSVPILLLMFLFAEITGFSPRISGFIAIVIYSFSHITEILRAFLVAYPVHYSEQAKIMGISPVSEWVNLRIPWTLRHAWGTLVTHWISLLKDTGALIVLGVGELTTVAKALSEASQNYDYWVSVLCFAALLYLSTSLFLVWILRFIGKSVLKSHNSISSMIY